jgi:hypothetical protein
MEQLADIMVVAGEWTYLALLSIKMDFEIHHPNKMNKT